METYRIVLIFCGAVVIALFLIILLIGAFKWSVMWSLGVTDVLQSLARIESHLRTIGGIKSDEDSDDDDDDDDDMKEFKPWDERPDEDRLFSK